MMSSTIFRRRCLLWSQASMPAFHKYLYHSSPVLDETKSIQIVKNVDPKWFTLPPFSAPTNIICRSNLNEKSETTTTVLKWIKECCPNIPFSVVQKLFRLKKVRREVSCETDSPDGTTKLQRVQPKDSMKLGDRIFLPFDVQKGQHERRPSKKQGLSCDAEEIYFIRSLVLYKDAEIIVLNKPPGMPVQGGIGITKSLDELAATCLTYDYPESPRLVHRLDRDSSGILVLARTQKSAMLLHSLFREKTFAMLNDNFKRDSEIFGKRYLALVIGSPPLMGGLISVPLRKVVADDGKSDRITLANNPEVVSSQPSKTQYRVISSCHGYTWLELSSLTGRKHQLRVHCAEALGTPIVGDYKYGRIAHRRLKNLPWCDEDDAQKSKNESSKKEIFLLHLHCKEMVLPNVDLFLRNERSGGVPLMETETISVAAPLPPHMKRMWDFLHSME